MFYKYNMPSGQVISIIHLTDNCKAKELHGSVFIAGLPVELLDVLYVLGSNSFLFKTYLLRLKRATFTSCIYALTATFAGKELMDTLISKPRASIIASLFVVFLLLMIASSLTPLLLHWSGLTKVNASVFFINRLSIWVVLLLLWLYVTYIEKQKLLIWTAKKSNVVFNILSVTIILATILIGNIIITIILNAITHQEVSRKFLEYTAILKSNIPLLLFTVLTAAVVEELIFRGFIQTRLEKAFNSPALGIILSSLLFAIIHLSYRTLGQFIGPLFIGLVFSFFYWKYKNIRVLIICHFLWDAAGLLIAIRSH